MSSGTEEDPTLSPEEMRAHLPAGHPTRIGRYRMVRVLGEGGMGTVYEAVQDHPHRTVALKVVRGGQLSPRLARRFAQRSSTPSRRTAALHAHTATSSPRTS